MITLFAATKLIPRLPARVEIRNSRALKDNRREQSNNGPIFVLCGFLHISYCMCEVLKNSNYN